MVSATSAYFAIFTLTNIFINVYLHKAVEVYRKTEKLPKWATDVRTFIETTDGTIKPYDINEIMESYAAELPIDLTEELKVFETKGKLKFLQLKATEDDRYDLRDDFEYKRSHKKTYKDYDYSKEKGIAAKEAELKLNEHRERQKEGQADDLDEFVKETMEEEKPKAFDVYAENVDEVNEDDDKEMREYKMKHGENFKKLKEDSPREKPKDEQGQGQLLDENGRPIEAVPQPPEVVTRQSEHVVQEDEAVEQQTEYGAQEPEDVAHQTGAEECKQYSDPEWLYS